MSKKDDMAFEEALGMVTEYTKSASYFFEEHRKLLGEKLNKTANESRYFLLVTATKGGVPLGDRIAIDSEMLLSMVVSLSLYSFSEGYRAKESEILEEMMKH